MKLRLLLRRLTVSAPNLSVRAQLPWPLRALMFIALLAIGGAAAMFIYDAGRKLSGWDPAASQEQLGKLNKELQDLRTEKETLSANANSAESRVAVERTAKEQLAQQVKQLEEDNARLKDDLSFFEGLLPQQNAKDNSGVYLRSAKVAREGDKGLRYRVLIMQAGRNVAQFEGALRFTVTYVQGGKSSTMVFPGGDPNNVQAAKSLQISLKHYQRLEGLIALPPGVQAKSVQVRVEDRSGVRAQETISL